MMEVEAQKEAHNKEVEAHKREVEALKGQMEQMNERLKDKEEQIKGKDQRLEKAENASSDIVTALVDKAKRDRIVPQKRGE